MKDFLKELQELCKKHDATIYGQSECGIEIYIKDQYIGLDSIGKGITQNK